MLGAEAGSWLENHGDLLCPDLVFACHHVKIMIPGTFEEVGQVDQCSSE